MIKFFLLVLLKGYGMFHRMPFHRIPFDRIHFTENTFYRMDVSPKDHFTEWTSHRMDVLPNGHFTESILPNGCFTEWTFQRIHFTEWMFFQKWGVIFAILSQNFFLYFIDNVKNQPKC